MLPFVRPIVAFLIAPMSISALLFTIGMLRGGESNYFDQLAEIVKVIYISEIVLGVPVYLLFRKKISINICHTLSGEG